LRNGFDSVIPGKSFNRVNKHRATFEKLYTQTSFTALKLINSPSWHSFPLGHMTVLNFISDLLHNHNIIGSKTWSLTANPTGFMIYLNWIILFFILSFRLLAKKKHTFKPYLLLQK